jgi:hypothetical protein
VTFVGALVLGAVDFPVALCAKANAAVIARMTAIATKYFAMLPSCKTS